MKAHLKKGEYVWVKTPGKIESIIDGVIHVDFLNMQHSSSCPVIVPCAEKSLTKIKDGYAIADCCRKVI